MIVLTNTAAQTVAAGQPITFNEIVHQSGCAEGGFRSGTGSVRLRANGLYEISFNANVSGATAGTPVQLSVELSGAPLPETAMVSTPAAAGDENHVSAMTIVKNVCGDFDRVTVVNTGTVDVTVGAYPALTIKRVA